ncbi:Essential recombination function protein [uncultured Caudovirales phage]|uniref:Essential recombination function protein n=1 Tax=uncultured Caudovirales phage TaxID=2100421 RepID=A0A6J7WGU7_9CAUD|nr:Essential recombination function protein [uncultured Caudovirales phage]
MKQIATALVKAQMAFGPALKTATNPHFRSRYADLSACVEAVMDGLNHNGIAMIQQCSESDTGVIVETVFIHESGEMLNCGKLHVPAVKHDPQGYGSALTYARRYSLMAACGIAPEDDDGNAASRKTEVKKSEVDESTMADLLAAIEATTTEEDLKKAYVKAYSYANGEFIWQKKVIAAKDKMKGKL